MSPSKPTRLTINAGMLMMALEDHSTAEHFLDLQTGDLVLVPDYGLEEVDDELAGLMEEAPARFLLIEPIPTSRCFQVMADFVESLPASPERDALAKALHRPHPFRAFKEELPAFPARREEWFRFHDEVFREMARRWLEDEEIEGDLDGVE